MVSAERDQYDAFAEQYTKIAALPLMRLEKELLTTAITESMTADARVLDLGGGAGLHARTAVVAGAHVVDLVDVSQSMMDLAKMAEQDEGRKDKIRFMLGDVTKPLDHLKLEEQSYDVVMANWVFDHATSITDLEGMWSNIAKYIKPGGRFINVRVNNVKGCTVADGRYGVIMQDFREIPNGIAYVVVSKIDPPLSFEATTLDITSSGSLEMHQKYGFGRIKSTSGENSDLIRGDPNFWSDYLANPLMAVVTAVKE